MTDLQFKCHLRLIIAFLRRAQEGKTLEEVLQPIEELKDLLQKSLES